MKHPLFVLMWKHRKEKMRRPCHSAWEEYSGVSIFIILLLLKYLVIDTGADIENPDFEMVEVIFTPNNTITRKLMLGVCKETNNTSSILYCHGVHNQSGINKFLRSGKVKSVQAFVDFENLNDTEIPEVLKYNIRIRDNEKKTKVSKSVLADLYHQNNDDDDLLMSNNVTLLTNLQWKIDKAYLEQLSGDHIDHAMRLKAADASQTLRMNLIHSFLKVCIILAPLPYFLYLSSKTVTRNITGMKELMKLYGVSKIIIRCAHLLDIAFSATIYSFMVTLLLKVTQSPILVYSNPFIIMVSLILHFVSTACLAFITSSLAQNYQHCDSLAVLIYMMMYIFSSLLYSKQFVSYFLCFTVPHAPVFVFWDEVTTLERNGIGTQFSNMWTSQGDHNIGSVVMVWIFFIGHMLLLLWLSWYLEKVRPGTYGIALPWNFWCRRKYWMGVKKKIRKKKIKGVNFHVTAEREQHQRDDRYFEMTPDGTEIAIKVAGVTKVFRNFRHPDVCALENIDLEVIKGEITVLLGINGAGKSTLLSIVTGMYSATQGTVYINGFDNSTRFHDLRNDLGFCPQREMIFDYLTVMENIYFFEKLRGESDDIGTNKEHYMRALDLHSVSDYYIRELPSGLRRALQIAVALVGDADVLVLDEPTTGMDSRLRHKVWDLLLALRKCKTMLVSTTAMGEADAIGDRIAMINKGILKCHGTPAFLKSALGADFKLSLRITDEKTNKREIEQIIKDNIPNIQVDMDSADRVGAESRMSLSLPSHDREQFPRVFDILEAKMKELGITMMDVGISMEQVFLRFLESGDDLLQFQSETSYPFEQRVEGLKLRFYQLSVLMKRVFAFVWFRKIEFLILQVLLPFIAFILVTLTSNTGMSVKLRSGTETFVDPTNATVLYHPIGHRRVDVFDPLVKHYPNVKFVATKNLNEDFEKLANKTKFGYKISGGHTDILYTTHPKHKVHYASTAVNIFSNMFMSLHMPYATANHHIAAFPTPMAKPKLRFKNLFRCFGWVMWIVFLSVVPVAPLILLCIDEYYKGVRFTHLHSSVPPSIIWLGKLIPHMCIYTAIVPTSVIFSAALLEADDTINQLDCLLCTFLFLMLFGPAFFIQWYVMSFSMSEHQVITKIYISSLLFGLILPLLLFLLYTVAEKNYIKVILTVMINIAHLSPVYTFAVGLYKVVLIARNNAYCKAKFNLCPYFPKDALVTREECCRSRNGVAYPYFSFKQTGINWDLVMLPILCVIYWIILMLLQRRKIQLLYAHTMNTMYKPPDKKIANIRVKAEEEFVRNKFQEFDKETIKERQLSNTVILAEDMHRVFRFGYGKPIYGAKGIHLSVEKGQCLGILGRNGAGKTTTLGLLSGFLVMTRGRCCIDGYYLRNKRRQYLQRVSWAMADGMDDFLSGYNNLKLLAALHGHDHKMACRLAMANLNFLGLTSHANQLFGAYSSGCAHRLAVAKALVSEASAVLLDEPCGNVDPHTRPLIVSAIRRLVQQGVAVVIAEESMEWKQMEHICNKLAIIDKGEVVAIGSVDQIRRDLTSGYTATLKLNVDDAYNVANDSVQVLSRMGVQGLVPSKQVKLLKEDFGQMFDTSLLIDEHISMLYFHIQDPNRELLYSQMFEKLEVLRLKYNVIEDYTLSETTVDEVLRRIDFILHRRDSKHELTMKILSLDTADKEQSSNDH